METPSADCDNSNDLGAQTEGSQSVEDEENESEGTKTEEVVSNEDQVNPSEQGETTNDHVTQVEDKEKVTVEHDDSSEISVTEREVGSQLKQPNGEIKSEGGEASIQGLQVSYHGAASSSKVGHSHSSVELGRMASSEAESNGEKSPERRRIGGRFLNRSNGNRVPKMNIFATAQARGRTLIPELRSKLSSFSQQVRSRSPRLGTRPRPSSDSESNHHQKQMRRKCRTKIIEL